MVNSVTTLMNEHMDKIGVIQILRSKRASSARRARRVCPEEGFWREGCVQQQGETSGVAERHRHVPISPETFSCARSSRLARITGSLGSQVLCHSNFVHAVIHHCCSIVDHLVVQLRFRRCCPTVKCPETVSVTCPRALIERCLRSHVERCRHTFSERCLASH